MKAFILFILIFSFPNICFGVSCRSITACESATKEYKSMLQFIDMDISSSRSLLNRCNDLYITLIEKKSLPSRPNLSEEESELIRIKNFLSTKLEPLVKDADNMKTSLRNLISGNEKDCPNIPDEDDFISPYFNASAQDSVLNCEARSRRYNEFESILNPIEREIPRILKTLERIEARLNSITQ